MLKLWEEAYFEVRAKIEASGRDSRWEFDRKKLFERTKYMADICSDLYNVAQVLSCTLIDNMYFEYIFICVSFMNSNPRIEPGHDDVCQNVIVLISKGKT